MKKNPFLINVDPYLPRDLLTLLRQCSLLQSEVSKCVENSPINKFNLISVQDCGLLIQTNSLQNLKRQVSSVNQPLRLEIALGF